LPDISVAEREKLFGSIDEVLKYTPGNPIREGVAGGPLPKSILVGIH
jgi:hypothetical protein